jgi:hypothetical protein
VQDAKGNAKAVASNIGYNDAKTTAELSYLAQADPIEMPDKAAVSANMADVVRNLFLRDPVGGEADALANAVIDKYVSGQMSSRFNPFAGNGSSVTAPFLKQASTVQDEINNEVERIRHGHEYEQLYGQKPAGMTEAQYLQQFQGAAQNVLGQGSIVPNEALRGGLASGQTQVISGALANDTGQAFEHAGPGGFRERLFGLANQLSEIL